MCESKFYAYDAPAADRSLQESGMPMPIKVWFSAIGEPIGGNYAFGELLTFVEPGTS
jgi:hypothetical protein